MKTTEKQIRKIQLKLDASAAELKITASLRAGMIDGKPDITHDRAVHHANRAEMLAALKNAGPRTRAKFHAEQWEQNFNADGSVYV